jgi:hypothetical protein
VTDGTFVKTGPMETGRPRDYGRIALLESGENRGVRVVATERRTNRSRVS